MLKRAICLPLAGSMVLATGVQSAWAVEPDAFGQRLQDMVQFLGFAIEYDSARAEADTIILSDFTVMIPGEDAVELQGDLVFSAVTETPEGHYLAGQATVADFSFELEAADEHDEFDQAVISVSNLVIEDIRLPAELETADLYFEISTLFSRASVGPVEAVADGQDVFSIAEIAAWMETAEAPEVVGSGFEMSGMRGNLALVRDADAQELFDMFGLEEIISHFRATARWDVEPGELEIEEASFTVEDLARLDLTGLITGYTTEFYEATMELNRRYAEVADTASEDELAALEEEIVQAMSDLGLARMSVRYDDDSLFTRTLEFIGAQQGVDGQTVGVGLRAMVPLLLVELDSPEFTEMVTSAVNAFFEDPQNIVISVEPEEPIRFDEIERIGDDLDALLNTLNLEVLANR